MRYIQGVAKERELDPSAINLMCSGDMQAVVVEAIDGVNIIDIGAPVIDYKRK